MQGPVRRTAPFYLLGSGDFGSLSAKIQHLQIAGKTITDILYGIEPFEEGCHDGFHSLH
jgi:hypothetical protein